MAGLLPHILYAAFFMSHYGSCLDISKIKSDYIKMEIRMTKKKNFLEYIYNIAEDKKFTTNEKTGIVTIKVENKGFYNRIAQKFFHKPKYSFIDLDQYGSFLWLLLDGKKDVDHIIKEMKEEFPEEADTMQDRVCRFIATLVHNNYIKRCDDK